MTKISSWGRTKFTEHEVFFASVDNIFSRKQKVGNSKYLPRGNGRSYGDVCTNSGGSLISSLMLDSFINFNPDAMTIEVQSGVILRDLQRFLVSKGFMLPVTPGTEMITVGGAIANDVHCKNHHKYGTFGNHVESFELVRSDGEILECSREKNQNFFKATIGGIGLTGFITKAVLKLRKVNGGWIDAENIAYNNLDEFFELATSSEADYEHTVSWIDCITGNGERGIFMRGNNSDDDSELKSNHNLIVPVELPFSMVNRISLFLFNKLYYLSQSHKHKFKVNYEKFFYPLDNILEWNRIYGSKGFFQYQCVLPSNTGLDATKEIQKEIAKSGEGSFLGVLKTFGDYKSEGFLSFPYKGFTYALDFPNNGQRTSNLFNRLDSIVKNAHGRLYLAKDARQPKELFLCGYGNQMNEFIKFVDPACSSDLSRRLMGF
ncbi:MAG: FAD-binding protein [Succinivibrio sp.]